MVNILSLVCNCWNNLWTGTCAASAPTSAFYTLNRTNLHPFPITTTSLSLRTMSCLHCALCTICPSNLSWPRIPSGFGLTNRPTAEMRTLHSCSITISAFPILSFKSQVLVSSCQRALSHEALYLMWGRTSKSPATFSRYERISAWSGNSRENPGFGANDRLYNTAGTSTPQPGSIKRQVARLVVCLSETNMYSNAKYPLRQANVHKSQNRRNLAFSWIGRQLQDLRILNR